MREVSFSEKFKKHQIEWAKKQNFGSKELEFDRPNRRPWVFKPEYKKLNLNNPNWWRFIEGNEHRWARAMNSSQCFAVNLFGPVADDEVLAKEVYRHLFSHRNVLPGDVVKVFFEFTPKETREWLGEKGHSTQIDVVFEVSRQNQPIGFALIEVKLTEAKFGSCRGALPFKFNSGGNPHPEKCQDFKSVIASPQNNCWLVEKEGRRYWEIMKQLENDFDFSKLNKEEGCPFQGGLYQIMRNVLLGISLVNNTSVEWVDVGICVHPLNKVVKIILPLVAGVNDALSAFLKISNKYQPCEIHPIEIISQTIANAPNEIAWGNWMRERYILDSNQRTL